MSIWKVKGSLKESSVLVWRRYEKNKLTNNQHSISMAFDLETSCHWFQLQSLQILPLELLCPTQGEYFSWIRLVHERFSIKQKKVIWHAFFVNKCLLFGGFEFEICLYYDLILDRGCRVETPSNHGQPLMFTKESDTHWRTKLA